MYVNSDLTDWGEEVRYETRREKLSNDLIAVVTLRRLALRNLGNVLSALSLLRWNSKEIFNKDRANQIETGIEVT